MIAREVSGASCRAAVLRELLLTREQRNLAAILADDVVGYSRLIQP
jgi:hypothetical protein